MASAAIRDRLASGAQASTSGGDPLAILRQQFPCRDKQFADLAIELSGDAPGNCVLVYGPPGTGKTSVVRALLTTLRVRHAYVNCVEASRPRTLLCSLVHQLKGGKRQREEGYECGIKCDSIAEFRLQLPGVVGGLRRGPCWLVLDNAQRLAGSDVLAALMRVREDTGVQLGVLLVGTMAWGSGAYLRDTAAALPPKAVHFAPYPPKELQQIMEQRRQAAHGPGGAGDAPAFRQFLTAFVPSFCRASNSLLDLQAAVSHLFPLYMQPLREGKQMQGTQLYNRIREQVGRCLRALELRPHPANSCAACGQLAANGGSGADADEGAAEGGDAAGAGAGGKASSRGLAFELPYTSKFLLLAAYVASRNKPTTDRAVFDPTYRKRGRRDAQAHDRKVEAAVEAELRGPHTFPLERLLHIFYVLYAHHDADDEQQGDSEAEEDAGQRRQAQRVMQQAEVLGQVCSLVALRLLEQCGGDALEGQQYRCNLGKDAVDALAANVRLNLADYLQMG